MLHLMPQRIAFVTATYTTDKFDAGSLTPCRDALDFYATDVKIADHADDLGSFNRPRNEWHPASVADTAVALLTGEVGLKAHEVQPWGKESEGETFTAQAVHWLSSNVYEGPAVRDADTDTVTARTAVLWGFSARQVRLISARIAAHWAQAAPAVIEVAPVVEQPSGESAEPVTVRVVGTATAVIVGPGFQGGVRRHPDKPRAFQVLAFGATADESEVIGTATRYDKAGALLAAHNGQPGLAVTVERVPANAA